ncbi:nuclear transport factor 2 family protein [Mycobacterium interjectum]|uniref:nuclear transport factor 2 family protein n=1 Tax=Mycobacterium interjectum TaxID=33895 RepID=UPI00082E00B1|nr:nuclear transport factor 2 family protein [Mycobacterium interjectum]MCV7088632.1 nuclear transport factor 2 family protein [Mycobacterium interjectum]
MTLSVDDQVALSDVVHRYASNVDDGQFDSVVALFTEEAELVLPEPPAELEPVHCHRGREAIAVAVAAVAAVTRTEHAIIGEVYDDGPRPGAARGRVACVAHHWSRRGDEVVDVVWHLRYDDDYRRTDAGWRIARRALTINAIETRTARKLLPRDRA